MIVNVAPMAVLDIDVADLASRSRQNHVVEARRLIVTLGRERWAQGTKELALAFGKSATESGKDSKAENSHDDMKVWMRISSRARLVTTGYNKSIKMVLMK
jgi:hypothetical protein